MPTKTIPAVLLFSNVAPNSNLNITFTSPGVQWSLGSLYGDSLGFSYNVVADGMAGSASCIQAITFNDALLSIRIAAGAPSSCSFTLTLSLTIEEGIDYLQGYCTMNSEATVQAFFGNDAPVRWYNGRISAVFAKARRPSCGVLLTVKGCKPGAAVEIEVGGDGRGPVVWTLGPDTGDTMGLTLYSAATALPLSSFSYCNNRLAVVTASGGTSGTDFGLVAFLTWGNADQRFITLKALCDPAVTIHAQVGNRQPQYVGQTQTLFTL